MHNCVWDIETYLGKSALTRVWFSFGVGKKWLLISFKEYQILTEINPMAYVTSVVQDHPANAQSDQVFTSI